MNKRVEMHNRCTKLKLIRRTEGLGDRASIEQGLLEVNILEQSHGTVDRRHAGGDDKKCDDETYDCQRGAGREMVNIDQDKNSEDSEEYPIDDEQSGECEHTRKLT